MRHSTELVKYAENCPQILCHSLERNYVITNLPWLFGSLGTMAEDIIIFIQFHLYGDKSAARPLFTEAAIE